MVEPVLLLVLIGVIYFLMRLLKRWGKMSKHETLNAVGTIIVCYGIFTAIVLAFPIAWFEKYILCGLLGLGAFIFGLFYFYRKQDIKINPIKLDYWFNSIKELVVMSAFFGFGTATLVNIVTDPKDLFFPQTPEFDIGLSILCTFLWH